MKNIKFLIAAMAIFTFFSCQNSNSSNNDEKNDNQTDTAVVENNSVNSENELITEQTNEEQAQLPDSVPEDEKDTLTYEKKLLNRIKNNPELVHFHGIGTEPFWDLYITENEVLYVDLGVDKFISYTLLTPFDKNKKIQTIKYKSSDGEIQEVTIKKEPASDEMSSRTYPYKVIFSETEPWKNGAGDAKLMTNWSDYE